MTLVFRTTADHFLDLVINHPSVRPTVQPGTSHQLTSIDVLADHRNVCLGGEGGAALFVHAAPGLYEGHIMLLDSARGSTGLAFGRAALAVMFGSYGAQKIVAAVPRALRHAILYVRRLGFVSIERDLELEVFVMEGFNG